MCLSSYTVQNPKKSVVHTIGVARKRLSSTVSFFNKTKLFIWKCDKIISSQKVNWFAWVFFLMLCVILRNLQYSKLLVWDYDKNNVIIRTIIIFQQGDVYRHMQG